MTGRANVYLLDTIKKILRSGIYLGAMTDSENYLLDLCSFFNERNIVNAIYNGDEVILETKDWRPILSLEIHDNTLVIIPLEEANFFQCFIDTIEFVTKVPKKAYKKKEEKTPKKAKEDEKTKKEINENEFEWI
jgi:hypothetical protein